MIFVFVEDGSLDFIENIENAERNYDAFDVESQVFVFFDERGIYLEPQFTKPNKSERFLGILKQYESGEFKLVPKTETDEDVNLYLLETSQIKPNPYFSNLEEVRQFFKEKINN